MTVMNNSGKTVTSLEYAWRIAPAKACASSMQPSWETASVDVTILPNEEASINLPKTLSEQGAAPDLAKEARSTQTKVVVVTIGILKVRYGDGSDWSDDEAERNHLFDQGAAERAERCHVPTAKEMQAKTGQSSTALTQPVAVNTHWWGEHIQCEVVVTSVTDREVSYAAVDRPFAGTVPLWKFEDDFQPVPAKKKGR